MNKNIHSRAPLHCPSWLSPARASARNAEPLNTVNPTVHVRGSHLHRRRRSMHMLDLEYISGSSFPRRGRRLRQAHPDLVQGLQPTLRGPARSPLHPSMRRALNHSACGRHHPALRRLHPRAIPRRPGTGATKDRCRSAGRGGLRQCGAAVSIPPGALDASMLPPELNPNAEQNS